MARTEQEKQEARSRNLQSAADIRVALDKFAKQLESPDIECLDEQFKDELIDIRHFMLKGLVAVNPIADEGIKSIAAQKTSGKMS